ncbi:hypothetical protein K493DRAFT_336411 [Basidiobolus meristosporus CBS 931.73]|uniref:CCHC-type domain-containing protein n=1 Tax=Basidiobolus meristosporus CBS 931.73 TaxID=1314790 RepID=A0A1Y1YJ52_9FUNG|nr:hypothetical protein K493DRAFT_336411 [Basidiobolus meristosporus CBS 931.73]|eukprot:ORX97786.1 hypothetical protein K493DRAFT_336411 [Basidiobolus meristosporus CBS 931.73]
MTSTPPVAPNADHSSSASQDEPIPSLFLFSPPNPGSAPTQDSPLAYSFGPGDEVFVMLRSDKNTGRATVISSTEDQVAQDRVQVRYHSDDSTYQVNPCRLSPVFPRAAPNSPATIILCPHTTEYRRLARAQILQTDNVLEIGSSYGICTDILSQHCGTVVGLETSPTLFVESRKRFPHCIFECLDVLHNPGRVQTLISEHKINVAFVDIGGNRDVESVVKVMKFLLPRVETIIVKNEALFALALPQLTPTASAKMAGRVSSEWFSSFLLGCADPHTPLAEPWFLRARSENFVRKPLRYPVRLSPSGEPICRPHNYDAQGCGKMDVCRFDHDHCHHCLEPGHKARDCVFGIEQ